MVCIDAFFFFFFDIKMHLERMKPFDDCQRKDCIYRSLNAVVSVISFFFFGMPNDYRINHAKIRGFLDLHAFFIYFSTVIV